MKKFLGVLLIIGLTYAVLTIGGQCLFRRFTPALPPVPVVPSPVPEPAPRRPILPWREAKVGGPISPDGQEEIQCDLPGELHKRNTGGIGPRGPGSGAGLCVFTSIEHSAIHQNVPELLGFQKWMTHRPGGGYPEKVDKMVSVFCKERGVPVPRYLQVEGGDMEILKLACKTGRMPGVTYCWSPTGRYSGKYIAHMVNIVHASDEWACVLDNNYPGEDRYEWMSWSEFRKTFMGNGGGWAVILLPPGPPPAPTN